MLARYDIPDSAIGRLLLFLYTFFQDLGHFSSFIAGLACRFPSSLCCLRKTLKVDNQFTKYIVCPKCEQLYHRDSCVRKIGTREVLHAIIQNSLTILIVHIVSVVN